LPSRAAWVRLRPNWSRTSEVAGVALGGGAPAVAALLALRVAGQQLDDLPGGPGSGRRRA